MRVLVTGAGGFVGRRLVVRLSELGHGVVAVVRPGRQAEVREQLARTDVEVLGLDLADLEVAALPGTMEAVITLGQSAQFRSFPDGAADVYDVNVTANFRLFDWAARAGVARFVHVSSGGVYGGRADRGVLREEDLLAVDSPLGFYLGTKLCAEVLFQNYRQHFETAVILRPFFVYGPGQRKDMLIARLIDSICAGRPINLQGGAGLRMNPIYVDDVVICIAKSLELTGYHLVNLGGPDVVSLRQIAEAIAEAVAREPVYDTRPGEPVDYVADTDQAIAKLIGSGLTSFREGLRRSIEGCLP